LSTRAPVLAGPAVTGLVPARRAAAGL